jgi:hypothetical protein
MSVENEFAGAAFAPPLSFLLVSLFLGAFVLYGVSP